MEDVFDKFTRELGREAFLGCALAFGTDSFNQEVDEASRQEVLEEVSNHDENLIHEGH